MPVGKADRQQKRLYSNWVEEQRPLREIVCKVMDAWCKGGSGYLNKKQIKIIRRDYPRVALEKLASDMGVPVAEVIASLKQLGIYEKKVLPLQPSLNFIFKQHGIFLLFLVLAFVLKFYYLQDYFQHIPYATRPMLDAKIYDLWAQKILQHGLFTGNSPFYQGPLYAYFLALIYAVFGIHIPVVAFIQLLLGLVTLGFTYAIGHEIKDRLCGLLAVLLVLGYAPLTFFETKIMSDTLGVTLLLAMLYFLIISIREFKLRWFMVAGLLGGLACLTRPAILLFALGSTGILVWVGINQKQSWNKTVLVISVYLATLALSIAPATLFNFIIGQDKVLISTNGGMTFYHGNNEWAKGLYEPPPGFVRDILKQEKDENEQARKLMGRDMKRSEISTLWQKKAQEFILGHPGAWIQLELKKLRLLFSSGEPEVTYNAVQEKLFAPSLKFFKIPFGLLMALALVGLFFPDHQKGKARYFIWWAAISTALTIMLIFMSSRYRMPMAPCLALMGAYGISQVKAQYKSILPWKISLAVIGVLFITNWSLVRFSKNDKESPETMYSMGVSFLQQGNSSQTLSYAVGYLLKAVELKPNDAIFRCDLGVGFKKMGLLDKAENEFKKAIELDPKMIQAYYNLGNIYRLQENYQKAQSVYQEVAKIQPDFNQIQSLLKMVEEKIREQQYR